MRAAPVRPGASRQRDPRLDFFRGVALIFIFVDHIPENVLSYFTLQAVQFYDAAEVFIFISGYTAALVYGRTLASKGALYATAQVLRRAWQLYVAHIFLFVIFTAEVSYTVLTFNQPMYNEEMRVGDFLEEPHIAIVKALLLQFQPTFLDILPLYIVLLAFFPLVLLGLRLSPLLVLLPSFGAYAVVQIFGLAVPAYPAGNLWYFNPLAWQFLFIAGASLGLAAVEGRHLPSRLARAALPASGVILAAALIVKFSWTIHGLWDPFPGLFLKELWPVNKSNLSPVRLVPFFALVVLVAERVRPEAAFLASAAARPFLLCGRHSLEIFCLGIILSALGHFVLSEYDAGVPTQLAVNLAGIAAMCLTAKMIDWYKALDREPVVPSLAAAATPISTAPPLSAPERGSVGR
ncbi:MAG: OpgC domain-containing protein [Alphaproteobacteria bacterium]|nr:OpgC domain-containing protein [Alphaproteobacteria bacterium]